MRLVLVFGLILAALALTNGQSTDTAFTWVCEDQKCLRRLKSQVNGEGLTLDLCKLTCYDEGNIWPKPTGSVQLGKDTIAFYPRNVYMRMDVVIPPIEPMVQEAQKIFRGYMDMMHPNYQEATDPFPPASSSDPQIEQNYIIITMRVHTDEINLKIGGNETYSLIIIPSQPTSVNVVIEAGTYFGMRHGLETLSHLMAYDSNNYCLRVRIYDLEDQNYNILKLQMLTSGNITDSPIYVHRGLSLDTSRNFMPLPILKIIIDGLSYNKMNVFHWHITDSQSFPMEIRSLPNMTIYGAYSPDQIYTTDHIKEIVAYAKVRGVKVIPELDAPSHSGHGYTWGPDAGLGNLVVCVDQEPWHDICLQPTCGELNPVNEEMYRILGIIYSDMLEMFDRDAFHMGGDEVLFKCWNATEEIVKHLQDQGLELTDANYAELWAQFQEKAYQKLTEANGGVGIQATLWTSKLTSPQYIHYLDKNKYIVQFWETGDHPQLKNIIENEFRLIMTNHDAVYLDCGFGAWIGYGPNNWCGNYKSWTQIYMNDIVKLAEAAVGVDAAREAFENGLFMGGETAMWVENTDANSVEMKVFPRTSAYAERLWTNPETDWEAAETRMLNHRMRISQRGVLADHIQMEWCYQNDGRCYGQKSEEPGNPTTSGPGPGSEGTTDGTQGPGGTASLASINLYLFSITLFIRFFR